MERKQIKIKDFWYKLKLYQKEHQSGQIVINWDKNYVTLECKTPEHYDLDNS